MPYGTPEERKAYHREYYLAHKDEYISRAKTRNPQDRELKRQIIRQAKEKPCADCGIQYPYYVMQFDHLGDKEFTIATDGVRFSLKRLHAEIAKCEVVCANCHAERTHQRRVGLAIPARAGGPPGRVPFSPASSG